MDFRLKERAPGEDEFRRACESILAVDPDLYSGVDPESLLLGFCLGKGMSARGSVEVVRSSDIKEDGR